MENRLLTGKELIDKKCSGPKDFPSVGWREYRPSNSWLEKKQIQACLEDKLSLLRSERVDKVANLATAEWLPEYQKAKVIKKVGKHWEVFGHYKENADWLFPEEALFLIETNVLQLLYGEVPVSIEQGYLLLIGEDFTLAEYKVYSFLLKRGYKVTRHFIDNKDTRHKKQVDQAPENSKRNESLVDSNKRLIESSSAESGLENKSTENDKSIQQGTEETTCNKSLLDDVYVVEDSVEIIEIVDSDNSVKEVKKVTNNFEKIENERESILIDDEDEDVDVVFVSNSLNSRCWYPPLIKSLIPQKLVGENNEQAVKYKKKYKESESFDLSSKTKNAILKTIGGNTQKNLLFAPDHRFLPDNIETKYSVYKINLHQLDDEENKNCDVVKNSVPTSQNVEELRNYNAPSHMIQNNVNDGANTDTQNNLNENHQSFMVSDHSTQSRPNYNTNYPYPSRAHFNHSASNYHNNHLNEQIFHNDAIQDQYYRPIHFRGQNYSNNFQPMLSQVNSRNSLLMRACEMQLMAANMMQTASQILAACNRYQTYPHQQMPFVPQNQLAFTSNQVVPFSRPIFSSYPNVFANRNVFYSNSNNNANYHQRQCNQRFHVRGTARKRQKRFYSIMNHGKNKNIPSSSKLNNEDIIVLDSDEEEKGCKSHIKKPHISTLNSDKKCFPVIDISNENLSDVEIILPPKDIVDLTNIHGGETDVNVEQNVKPEHQSNEPIKGDSNAENIDTISVTPLELYNQDNQIIMIDAVSNTGPNYDVAVQNDRNIDEPNNEECIEVPANWEQFKNYSPPPGPKRDIPLVDLDKSITKVSVYESLHLFNPVENSASKGKLLKVSFDAYLPTDHFKKSFKMSPKLRIIVMREQDIIPTTYDLDALKEFYQDKIPFLFAVVLDESVTFYNYDHISLPSYF